MNGQGNIQETRLAELTLAILSLDKRKDKYLVWSLTRHKIKNMLEDLTRERSMILENKKAGIK